VLRAHMKLICVAFAVIASVTVQGAVLPGGPQVNYTGISLLYKYYGAEVIATVSTPTDTVDLSQPEGLPVVFTAFNPSNRPVTLLNRMTPFEGILDDLLVVRDEATGRRMKYKGATASRDPIEGLLEKDYLQIGAGQSRTVVLDIADEYTFDVDGTYQIRLKQPQPKTVVYQNLSDAHFTVSVYNTQERKAHQQRMLQEALDHKEMHSRLHSLRGAGSQGRHVHVSEFSDEPTCSDEQQQQAQHLRRIVKSWLESARSKDFTFGAEAEYSNYITKTLDSMAKHWGESNFNCCNSDLVDHAQQKANPKAAHYQQLVAAGKLLDIDVSADSFLVLPDGTKITETKHPDDRRIVAFTDGTKVILEHSGSMKGHVLHHYTDGSSWAAKPNHCLSQHSLTPNTIAAFVHPTRHGPRVINICPSAFENVRVLALSFIHEMSHFIDSHTHHTSHLEADLRKHKKHPPHATEEHATDEQYDGHPKMHQGMHAGAKHAALGSPELAALAAKTSYLEHSWGESTCLVMPGNDPTKVHPSKAVRHAIMQRHSMRAGLL